MVEASPHVLPLRRPRGEGGNEVSRCKDCGEPLPCSGFHPALSRFQVSRRVLADDPHYDYQVSVTCRGRTLTENVSGGEPIVDAVIEKLKREFDLPREAQP